MIRDVPLHLRAAKECERLAEKLGPVFTPARIDRGPFAEAAPRWANGCASPRSMSSLTRFSEQFHQKVTGAAIERREELTVDPQARQAHHGGSCDGRGIKQWRGHFPELSLVGRWSHSPSALRRSRPK